MCKSIHLLTICLLLFSCSNSNKQNTRNPNSTTTEKSILNELILVEKWKVQNKLYPVRMLWLGQTKDSSKINNDYKSFVTIWKTKDKNETILVLWNKGKIQKVYYNVEGVKNTSKKTDFFFYIRASNLNDAKVICNSLPFYQEGIASYQIISAGASWLGIYDKNHLS